MPSKPITKGSLTRPRRSQTGRRARAKARTLREQHDLRLKNLKKARKAKAKKLAASKRA